MDYMMMEAETADDLKLGEVRTNTETNVDQLQVEGVTVGSTPAEPSSSTETESSSLSLGLSAEENGYHGLSAKECEDLRSIALRMNSKGRLDNLVNVYVKERKSFRNVHFQKLWDEKLSSSDIQRLDWNDMEKRSSVGFEQQNATFGICFHTRSIFPSKFSITLEMPLMSYVFTQPS